MQKAKLLCGASVIVHEAGRILLQRRADNGCWGYPGGRVEPGESVEDTARRELFEETGVTALALTLFGVFSGPALHHVYPDGNEVYIVDIVFLCDRFEGKLSRQEAEVLDLRWFPVESLPENISPPVRPALVQFVERHIAANARKAQLPLC